MKDLLPTVTWNTTCTTDTKSFSPLFTNPEPRAQSPDPLLNFRFWRLVLARIHLSTIFVEGPERVPEQERRIVLLLERDQALPVLAKGGGNARGDLVPSKELRIAQLHMRTSLFAP